jgi:hypothetical protein
MRLSAAFLTACALAACSPQAADTAAAPAAAQEIARHPESGLAVIPLTVISGGKRHAFRVELAESPREQARGLMFRTQMGADEGMIFPLTPPRMASFWMRNTVMSLDIIFIDGEGRIINIAADTVPYSEEHVLSEGLAHGVLELNAGRAAQLGIAPGDVVEW